MSTLQTGVEVSNGKHIDVEVPEAPADGHSVTTFGSITKRYHRGRRGQPEATFRVIESGLFEEEHFGPGLTLDRVIAQAIKDRPPCDQDGGFDRDIALFQGSRVEALIRFQDGVHKAFLVGDDWPIHADDPDLEGVLWTANDDGHGNQTAQPIQPRQAEPEPAVRVEPSRDDGVRCVDDATLFRHPPDTEGGDWDEASFQVVDGGYLAELHTGRGLDLDMVLASVIPRMRARTVERPGRHIDIAIYSDGQLETVMRFRDKHYKTVEIGDEWMHSLSDVDSTHSKVWTCDFDGHDHSNYDNPKDDEYYEEDEDEAKEPPAVASETASVPDDVIDHEHAEARGLSLEELRHAVKTWRAELARHQDAQSRYEKSESYSKQFDGDHPSFLQAREWERWAGVVYRATMVAEMRVMACVLMLNRRIDGSGNIESLPSTWSACSFELDGELLVVSQDNPEDGNKPRLTTVSMDLDYGSVHHGVGFDLPGDAEAAGAVRMHRPA